MSTTHESRKDFRAILAQINSPQEEVRKKACDDLATMAKVGDKFVIGPLIRLLKSQDYIVRFNACEALGQACDSRSMKPLIARLHDEKRWVRESASRALGNIGNPRAIEPLLDRLDDSFDKAKNAALRSLDLLGEGRLATAIVEKDAPTLVRLAMKGDIRPVDVIITILKETDPKAQAPLKKAMVELFEEHHRIADKFLCKEHFTRFIPHEILEIKTTRKNRLSNYACRTCGRTMFGARGISEVVAVLDSETTKDLEYDTHSYRVNYSLLNQLFDFNKVEILKASNSMIEQFCLKIDQDSDAFRKDKYASMTCLVSPNSGISDHSKGILKNFFKQVIMPS